MNDTTEPHADWDLRDLANQAFAAASKRGISSVAAWTAFLADARNIVNHYRGLECADLVYLDGLGMREIVVLIEDLVDEQVSHQAIADWLRRFGPARYLTVAHDETAGTYTLDSIPVMGTIQTRRELQGLRALGRRIAPARWQVRDDVDAEQLWHQLDGATHYSPAPTSTTKEPRS
ncbi:MAG: hypothetical protein ABWZ30_00970 [Jiangellaceae bacterium]